MGLCLDEPMGVWQGVSLHLSHWPPAQQMVTEIICNAFFMSLKEMLQKLFMEVSRYYSFMGSPCPLK